MKITREQLKALVGEVVQEEKDYQSFFQAMLKKHGVDSPADFQSDDEKKDFFNKVEKAWNGVSERLKEIHKEAASDVNTANIPAGIATKLDQATDRMKDAKINNQQKLQIIARVIDAIGLDKMNLAASLNKLRTKMEMTEEEMTQYQKVFKGVMDKFGINSPAELDSDEKKKEFFNAVDKAYPNESVNEAGVTTKKDIEKLTSYKALYKFFKANKNKLNKKYVSDIEGEIGALNYLESDYEDGDVDREEVLIAVEEIQDLLIKSLSVKERVNEGKYDADLDKVEAAVKGASSFMGVGAELKKAGIKYTFVTEMIPMYMIPVPGNTIAICNKKYAAGAEREVKDMAIGLLK